MADSNISKFMKSIQNISKNLYGKTYYTSYDNKKILNTAINKMDNSIDNLLNKVEDTAGFSNISRLYTRAQNKQNSKLNKNIEEIFGNETLMGDLFSMYSQNAFIKDLNGEIDAVCKYMPQLEEALDVKKDNVLCADSFNKDFINIQRPKQNKTENYDAKIREIKKVYDLLEYIDNLYYDISKYGERFVYIVPYSKAISKVLNQNNIIKVQENQIIIENGSFSNSTGKEIDLDYIKSKQKYKLEIKIKQPYDLISEAKIEDIKIKNKLIDDKFINDLEVDSDTVDGLIDTKSKKSDTIKINGCFIKTLKQENVLPLYIDDVCLGYLYIESEQDIFEQLESIQDPAMAMKKSKSGLIDSSQEKRDELLKYLSDRLIGSIDTKFINNNPELRKEIYILLKHHNVAQKNSVYDKLNVTFLPPDDVQHFFFEQDKVTKRGISDLSKSLMTAKFYACIYISNVIGILTRGQDKRVYYVKQAIDTNISQLLLATINQIKKSNFGMREINNINSILNITGKYNDYIIPQSQSGESPIQFEIMPGQDIPIKTELLELLESMAVNATGVPLDVIQNRLTADYATRLVMTNNKFQKNVTKRQGKFQNLLSSFITKIYNYHFSENEDLKVMLPPASYLSIQNTLSLLQNFGDYTANIMDVYIEPDWDDKKKATFRRKFIRAHLSTHIDSDLIERIIEEVELESSKTGADSNED